MGVKKRFYNHRGTFENEDHENPTTLSSHVWDLKKKNKNYNIRWSVIDKAKDFNPATKKFFYYISTGWCNLKPKM